MKISDDQNTVEVGGITGEFVSGGGCPICCFNNDATGSACNIACHESERADGRNGHFKEVTGNE